MMQLCVLFLLSSLRFLSASHEAEDVLTEYFKVCHRSDPELEKCIGESIEALRPYLGTGIPKLKIPKCDPLVISEFVVIQGQGAISMTSTYSNIVVTGASEFRLDSVRVDLENKTVQIQLFLPRLKMRSNYTMTGRIMILPIADQGISHGNYSDITATCSLQGKEVTKEGHVHWLIDDLFLTLEIGNATIHVDGLFPGNQELGLTLNRFLNDNWRSVAEDIKPTLAKKLGDKIKEITNPIFDKFPVDVLLPP